MFTPLYGGDHTSKIARQKYTRDYLKWLFLFPVKYQAVIEPLFLAWPFARTSVALYSWF